MLGCLQPPSWSALGLFVNFNIESIIAFLCSDKLRMSISSSVGILPIISLKALDLSPAENPGIAFFWVFRFALLNRFDVNKLSKFSLVGSLFLDSLFLGLEPIFDFCTPVLPRFDHG